MLPITRLSVVLAVLLPGAVRAAAPAAGLRFQQAIYMDLAEVPLRAPEGVACDDRGAVVIADTGNGRLLTYRLKNGALEGGAQVKLAQLPYPVRVQIDSRGFVLALDRRTRKIVRIDAKGEYAGIVEPQGASYGVVVPAAFRVDSADAVYVLDVTARKVVVAAASGRVTRELPLPSQAP